MRLAVAALAVALLLLPAAAPATPPASPYFLGAELQFQFEVNAKRMNVTDLKSNPAVPGVSPVCGAGQPHFLWDQSGAWFRFQESAKEKGCGEARFTFDVPEGATHMQVRFVADRFVLQDSDIPGFQLPVNFTQEVRTYTGPANTTEQYRYRHNTFANSAPSQNPTTFNFTEPVGGAPQITVGWFFQDEGTDPRLPQNAFVDQVIQVLVEDATVTFTGIPTEATSVAEQRVAEGYKVARQTLTVVVPVTAPQCALGREATCRVGLEVRTSGILKLENVTDPLDGIVPDRSVTSDDKLLEDTILLHPNAVARQGYGDYKFRFTYAAPLEPALGMTLLVILMVLLPGVMAVLSIRQWLHLRRQAGTSYPHVAHQYLWALVVAQAVYLIVLTWVLIEQPFPLLVSWPMEPQAVLLLGILLACTAAFFALAFLAKGRLVRLAEADLASKRRANLELERSNRDLEQFAYVASHDLQEPLRAVAGYTQLLQHRYGNKLDPQAQQYIKNAVDGADRMLGLIHGLLAYARIGTEGAQAAPVDLEAALGEALGNLEAPLKESKGRVTHGRLPTVQADRQQAVQLLQNLVGNALKFHAPDKPPRIHVDARETGTGEWVVEVRDNGIGIPSEHQQRIFQIFQRLHPRDRYPGSGLGLAICQRIVERHGGRIWVESKPGQGARFVFTMPKPPARQARPDLRGKPA